MANREPKNRSRRARENAGLSIGQAALRLGLTNVELNAMETTDLAFWDADRGKARHATIADLYDVSVPWLRGEGEHCDYAAVNQIPGGRELPFADRDALAELLASRPKGRWSPDGTKRCRCCGNLCTPAYARRSSDPEWSTCAVCVDTGCTGVPGTDGDQLRGLTCPLVVNAGEDGVDGVLHGTALNVGQPRKERA